MPKVMKELAVIDLTATDMSDDDQAELIPAATGEGTGYEEGGTASQHTWLKTFASGHINLYGVGTYS